MSKFTVIGLWEQLYPYQTEVNDYTGRKMLKSAIGNQNSRYCPTIDHIRPLSKGGKDILGNIVLCNIRISVLSEVGFLVLVGMGTEDSFSRKNLADTVPHL